MTGITQAERDAMTRAFELARRGPLGINPQVGCVLLTPAGDVLAEGWHRGVGMPHAEVAALAQLPEGGASGATAVVSLEPCNHTGHTGPCSEALLAAGIARVVYSVTDPGTASGGGAKCLRAAGVEVESGVLRAQGEALLGPWLVAARLRRPHVTVKWAQSLDGRAAAADGTSQWITGAEARADVHRRRAAAHAIIAGTGTILADDAALTARDADGALLPTQPLPVVLGTREIPATARVRQHPREPLFAPGPELHAVLSQLYGRGIQSVFVEGGPTLASAFIRAGLADALLAYTAPVLLGGPRAALTDLGVDTIAAARRLRISDVQRLGDDLLIIATPVDAETAPAARSAPSTGAAHTGAAAPRSLSETTPNEGQD